MNAHFRRAALNNFRLGAPPAAQASPGREWTEDERDSLSSASLEGCVEADSWDALADPGSRVACLGPGSAASSRPFSSCSDSCFNFY
jgi:hypothetical protein